MQDQDTDREPGAPDTAPGLSRRAVVAGAGVAALGVTLAVTGCSTAPTSSGESGGGSAPAPAPAAAGTALGPASDVPVGGGRIYEAQGVAVTQPTAGTYEGFSLTCTHKGCTINQIANNQLVCPCHGSKFALDGGVVQGPAERGLDSRPVNVTNGQITLA
ncbi:QcrA and Rieske domain-containing protein [Pseudonocardia bannensis]|uniref:Cytochrome bc1 complex Rieske iron-sulfur subunit n=1 Tax=Pseudonocardia bannensis TaxID=630973 RepID=A0A848DKF8_9PSEU|nr:Rieske (2Fe-2S) protein [Pseudonocardia bannensis]NMH93172.1 Rieske (2Fe-2S) protein [Pseudonocardia bannensis]